jgi:hypothetical protein
MKYEMLASTGLDVMALGNVGLTVFGLGLTAVSIKVARDTLKANKTAVELAVGPVRFDTAVVGSDLHVTNRSLRVSLHRLFLAFGGDEETPRDEFVASAHPLATRCHLLDEGQTLKLALASDHLDRLQTNAKSAVIGIDYSVIDGVKPSHWYAQRLVKEAA